MRGRTLTRLGPVKDVHGGLLTDLAVDAGDRLWVVAKSGLSMFDGTRWQRYGEAEGLVAQQVDDVQVAGDGRVWVLADTGLFVGENANTRFARVETLDAASHMTGLALAPNGEVWRWSASGDDNLCRLVPQARRACWTTPSPIDARFDAHGALWWRAPDGLARIADPAALAADLHDIERRVERIGARPETFAFGSDGSVWLGDVATGLVRLRQTPLAHLPTPTGALAPAADGSVWLGSFTRGLMRVGEPAPGTPLLRANDDTLWTADAVAASDDLRALMTFEPLATPAPAGTPVVLARHPEAEGNTLVRLDPTPDGGVRLGTLAPPRLVAFDGARAQAIALPPLDRGSLLRGAITDARGDLWLAVARNAVPFFRLHGGEWQPYGGLADVDKAAINGFTFDGDTLWVAVGKDAVGRARDGRWTNHGPAEGVALGQAIQPHVLDGQLWVTGVLGLQALVGERFVSLVGHDGDRFAGASGVVLLDDGDLWLNGVAGLSRIACSEWSRALREPGYRVAYTRLDHFDGNMASAMQGAPLPSLVRAADGRLWAATHDALLRFDPAAVRPAMPPPVVQLLALHVDGIEHAIADGLELPVGAGRIGIAFAAPPTDNPERVRYRYRLQDGGAWIDAGDRREVVYEALPHGHHVFEVMASDRDGRFGDTPTRLAFVLPPRFHQTTAFHLLVALAFAGLLAAAYAIRTRQIAERTQRDTTARLHERMRIARDLHDTLLQNVQALHMHVQAIAARVPDDDPLRPRIDLVLDRAQDTIREGRDRIGTLRDPLAGTSDLADCLQRIAQRLAREADVLCEVQVEGAPRALQPRVYDELLQIGREALANALQHAHATRVMLRIAFDDAGVAIAIADDGCGFPSEVLQHGGRDGHFGLRSMRERAALVGAELQVRNGEGAGAEVVIHVPAQQAYLPDACAQGWLARWFARAPRGDLADAR